MTPVSYLKVCCYVYEGGIFGNQPLSAKIQRKYLSNSRNPFCACTNQFLFVKTMSSNLHNLKRIRDSVRGDFIPSVVKFVNQSIVCAFVSDVECHPDVAAYQLAFLKG